MNTRARRLSERRGRLAEARAALHLTLKGYRIVSRNLRTPPSEIDILALRGGVLAVVEVKSRARLSDAEGSLSWPVRRRLDAACEWIADNHPLATMRDGTPRAVRLDLILIAGARLRHIPDAWMAGD